MSLAAAGLAFLAGLLSFLSPCVLPLLPVYLSYVSGVGVDRLQERRGRVVGLALLFVAGFTVVFVLLGAGAGGIGSLLVDYRRALTVAAGLFVAVSGLIVAGVIRLPERAVGVVPRPGGPAGAFLTGAALAIGWTPCIGYVLGGILTMAASSQSAVSGAVAAARLLRRPGRALRPRCARVRLDGRPARRGQTALPGDPGSPRAPSSWSSASCSPLGFFERVAGWLPVFVPGGL